MKNIRNEYTNTEIGAPNNWDEETPCTSLIICRDGLYQYSYWSPSWKERLLMLFNYNIRLCVYGKIHPPVAVEITK